MATLVDIGLPEWRYDPTETWEAGRELGAEYFAAVKERCREVGGDGEFVGEIVKWSRADGYAYYAVVNTDPLELVWVPYGDMWQVEAPLIRGLILDDVVQMIERDRAWAERVAKARAKAKS